jgi:hypothetical protein
MQGIMGRSDCQRLRGGFTSLKNGSRNRSLTSCERLLSHDRKGVVPFFEQYSKSTVPRGRGSVRYSKPTDVILSRARQQAVFVFSTSS